MYLCICNAVKQGEVDKYHLIGTKCGKCVENCPKEKRVTEPEKIFFQAPLTQ
jgi:bacterioferritin-associated ferredoxin